MYPGTWAQRTPDRPAVIMGGSGEVVTYAELDARSNRLAQLLHAEGLRPGDHLAIFMENHPRYLEVAWAGLRSGLYVTAVNSHLTAAEAGYIIDDCDASVLVTSAGLAPTAAELVGLTPKLRRRLMVDAAAASAHERYEDAIDAHPEAPLADEPYGDFMLYSSGTTGRPKGIKRPLPGTPASEGSPMMMAGMRGMYGFHEGCVYLSPAPMYHSAPLQFCAASMSFGATVVVMERFDPRLALELIERYRVTHSQWVPTMFVRMLKLPEEERRRYDLSSLEIAIHAAAPCPVWVKEQMIEWWGPILFEYYAGTEGNGSTAITSEDWLTHKGSVGRPLAAPIHICAEDGTELPPGEAGLVYFENPAPRFDYHNDPAKTASVRHAEHPGWTTLGDVGYLDEDGYLYLTDRQTFMIVSGGVNIYPQEIEDVLVAHPEVADAAVFGVPNDDLGEEVKAVVQPLRADTAGPALAEQLSAWCRERLAAYKCPRSIDFEAELPRLDTGKLYKRLLRDRYWAGHGTRLL